MHGGSSVILAAWEWEIKRIKASLGKKFTRSHLNQWLGTLVCLCHTST
jgi:hypothetical protein